MPQLDKFTYFSQFFWLCLFFFTFYIAICNNGDGLLGISRILKLRNQLISNQGSKIQSKDPNSLEDIVRKGFSTGVSYMYSILFEVSQWCKTIDYLGKSMKLTLISLFGEIISLFLIDKTILPFFSMFSYNTSSSRITCRNEIMLLHVLHGHKKKDNFLHLSLLHPFHTPLPCSILLIKWHSVHICKFDHLQGSKIGWTYCSGSEPVLK